MSQTLTEHIIDGFNNGSTWPPPFLARGITIRDAIGYLDLFEPFEYIADGCALPGQCESYANQMLATIKRVIKTSCRGLCLRCVKEDCVELHASDVPRNPWAEQNDGPLCRQATHQIGPRLRVR